ncbi:hypothetical protein TVAG_425860 [Trichomonas vaginalis G3]|uniref:Cyclophilin-like domain-containing protein n=1 Tax=Trichomonas vaginalis (strain ATCC PRA-98 / G3) TaxID=412133 RepID=A2FGX5_TRIV3|nr:sulfurtransferase protein [Trichomonas vaginalis G3]EAX95834.1 hypothetical protein TVAG_425860 [Trichomonas vaginalis G3]KAI5494469.1 sulfurtransferase protein [Trichomonas vaginalis G3]|eukprot:XP_001308764.1 hypothetical protein [Trichomonas vaginalis G3]
MLLQLTIGSSILFAEFANNTSADGLREKLSNSSITLDISDYSKFEKVGELGFTLPRNDEDITTQYGDLILYLGKRFVIYYDVNHWSLTRLGKIMNITQDKLKSILGEGDVTVTLCLAENSSITTKCNESPVKPNSNNHKTTIIIVCTVVAVVVVVAIVVISIIIYKKRKN